MGQLEEHKKSDEHRKFFEKLVEDKQIRKEKAKFRDQEFIVKYLFNEIDKEEAKMVSK